MNPSHDVQVDTDQLYDRVELAYAKVAYSKDHPLGPHWDDAPPAARGPYLDRASAWHLEGVRAELYAPIPRKRSLMDRVLGRNR